MIADSTLELDDLSIERNPGRAIDGLHGVGVTVSGEGTLTLRRCLVDEVRQTGIGVIGRDAQASLFDTRVARTRERGCVTSTCPDLGFGSGVVAALQGRITMERFVIEDSALCGVRVLDDASVTLRQGLIAGNAIGANVQAPGYDRSRLANEVDYRDNAVNFDQQELALPELPGVD
jgi:hypothetical protein